jgi:hypothetical protein
VLTRYYATKVVAWLDLADREGINFSHPRKRMLSETDGKVLPG